MVGDRLGILCLGRLDPAVADEAREQLGVVDHLVVAAEVWVLVGQRVEAVGAAGDDLGDAGLVQGLDVLLGEGLEDVLVADPARRVTGAALAGAEDREIHIRGLEHLGRGLRGLACPLVERRGTADPVEVLGSGVTGFEDLDPQVGRPVGALGLRLAPWVRGALDVAEHRLGLGREARLDHHQVPAQVDDVVDVLDRDRAGLDARAARHAIPHALGRHRVRHERCVVVLLGEHRISEPHDHELRGEDLAGGVRGAGVLAAAALGARERVEHLLPGEVGCFSCAEAEVLLGDVGVVELERLEAPAGASAPEPHVDRRHEDVQVLGAGEVGQEAQDRQDVDPDERALEDLRRLVVGEQMRERVRDRRPACGPFVQVQRDAGRVPEEKADHDRRDQGQDQVGLAQVAALEAARALDLADVDGRDDADEYEHAEDVDEQRVPALVAEPREGRVLVDDPDQRDQDRREQHHEAPEDERVHEAGNEALKELALTQDDRGFIPGPAGCVTGTLRGLGGRGGADQGDEGAHARREQGGAGGERGGEG